ncbi:glycoside hydrolase family 18 protein [Medicago truncatula]|uniref:Glycoside hydrolase family 18 protein n=1 Tax=Medicago truncatula TaxID=3880 RepID=G7LDM9_MEDTR|nr:glycoside hydrolase family 18 protein [Medicago truncatula]
MLGEAMGISQALQWVDELGFDGIDFSLGSKITVDSFNGGIFSNSFHNSTVEFSRQQTNEIDHQISASLNAI